MKTSEAGIEFIKQAEGYAATPYKDNGHIAWGYGHDQQSGETAPPMISPPDADLLLRHDLEARYEPSVNALIPSECTQNQFDALVDFAYNLGTSSLRMMVGHGWDKVPEQIGRWNHVNGKEDVVLNSRRVAEIALFNS